MDDSVHMPPSAPASLAVDSEGPWGPVQEALASAYGMSVGRVPRGAPQGPARVSLDSPVCRLMRDHPEAGQRCQTQCDEGVAMTLRTGRTQLFQCHARMSVFITLPEVVGQERRSPAYALIGGRVFLNYDEVHRFRAYAGNLGLSTAQLEALIPDIRVAPLERVKDALDQCRTIAGSMLSLESSLACMQDQNSRLRYLMEVCGGLEAENPEELPRAALNGPSVVFDAAAGLILERPAGGDRFVPAEVFPGNGFSAEALQGIEVSANSWFEKVLTSREGLYVDSIYDLLRAGFPGETASVSLFSIATTGRDRMVALLNTPLTPEGRTAIAMYCRHAALLIERHQRVEAGESRTAAPEPAASLWNTDDDDTLCQRLLAEATRGLDAEQGSVMLVDPKEHTLRIRAIQGVNVRYVDYVRQRRGEGIAGAVLERGEPLLVQDIGEHPEFRAGMRARYRTRSFVSVPIQLNDTRMGVINITDKRGGGNFTARDLYWLQQVTANAALALDRIRAREQTEELRQATMTDYRTGLLNPQAFDQRLEEEVERAQRYPYANPLSLLVADIDFFRNINNNFDYLAGDDCIVSCARLLERHTRNIDSVFRRGGEEFTVILPHTSRDAAVKLAERLRQAAEENRVLTRHAPHPLSFTISLGVSTFPEDGNAADTLFQRATQALHAAKKMGRNRVVTLPPNVDL